ncbi:hypothetical protein BDZ89DRAFT_1117050 [Hymenopellis radicata]|nr:hypothetical protein BDZ89DRAFT_1117050 [Hymenopellis radicata]
MNNYPTWRSDVQTTTPFSAGLNPDYEDVETSTNYTTTTPDVTSVTGSLPPLSPLRRGQSGGYPAEKADSRMKMRVMASPSGWTSHPPTTLAYQQQPEASPSYSPRSAESLSFNALTPTSPTTYNAMSQESRVTDSSGLTPLQPLRAASSWRTTSEDVPAPKGPRYR